MNLRRLVIGLSGVGLLAAALAVPAAAWAAGPAAEGGGGAAGLFALAPLLIVFPVAGLLINLALGRQLGEAWVGLVACGAAGLAFVIAVLQVVGLQLNHFEAYTVLLADWIHIQGLHVPWALQIDTLSVTMMLVVTGVGTLIHIYAVGYMHDDVRHNGDPGRFARFFVFLNLFLAAMLILVTGDSYLVMFVGWEGVGLCSYLLIGFWFEKGENHVGNARAGRKAFVVNRIGDWAMLMAIFLIFWTFGSLTYAEVFERTQTVRVTEGLMTAIGLLLLIGATGKSAQVPLYVWLPDAMAGPTPVSALIHAATMVTAGIYMITRSHALFALAPAAQDAVALVGGITALWAATIAVGQFDIKRVLAYSTISQLGFMVAAVGLGGYVAGMFHLVTHAFFKALLFLSSGSVIQAVERGHAAAQSASGAHGGGHAAHDAHDAHPAHAAPEAHGHDAGHHGPDPQDMRNMGGLWGRLPVTKWVYLIGALALAGIFPFAGFWSKDEVLLDAFKNNPLVYGLLTVAAFFTAFYMGRQILMVFFGRPRTEAARFALESPRLMTYPLIVLAFLSVVGGALNLPSIAGWVPPGAHALGEWLGHSVAAHAPAGEAHAAEAEAEAGGEAHAASAGEAEGVPALDFGVAGISTGLALLAIGLSFAVYRGQPATPLGGGQAAEAADPLRGMLGPIFIGMHRKWWVDEFYDLIILRPYNWLARFLAEVIDWDFWHDWFHDHLLAGTFNAFTGLLADGVDKGFVDPFISHGPAELSQAVARGLRRLQSGYVRGYALAVFVGVVAVLGYFLIVH